MIPFGSILPIRNALAPHIRNMTFDNGQWASGPSIGTNALRLPIQPNAPMQPVRQQPQINTPNPVTTAMQPVREWQKPPIPSSPPITTNTPLQPVTPQPRIPVPPPVSTAMQPVKEWGEQNRQWRDYQPQLPRQWGWGMPDIQPGRRWEPNFKMNNALRFPFMGRRDLIYF